MSQSMYIAFWAAYLASSVFLLMLLWSFTRGDKLRWLASIVRLVAVVLLLTPAQLFQNPDYAVPASFSYIFDSLLGRDQAAFSALVYLIVSAIVCMVIYLIYLVSIQIVHSRKSN